MAPFASYAASSNTHTGHQLANSADLKALADAGATALTHLGNGCPQTLHRHDNMIWAGLAEDRLQAMIICDGHHLPDTVIKVILRAKGVHRCIAVSDLAPVAGLSSGTYPCFGTVRDALLHLPATLQK